MSYARELTWSVKVNDAASGMISKIDSGMDKIVAKTKLADKKLEGFGKGMQKFSGQMGKMGSTMTKAFTAPIVGIGTASVKTVADFDATMSKVKVLSGATGDEFDALRDKARQLGKDTPHSATEAAEGMAILAAAGLETNQILGSTEHMLNLMSAGDVGSDLAAKVLTTSYAQFDLEGTAKDAERVADAFTVGAKSATTDVGELQEAFKMGGTALAGMNMDVEESMAMFDMMAKGSLVGSQAGTTVTALSRDIKANSDKFKEYGINVYDSTGKARKMGEVLGDLERKMRGMTDAQKDSIKKTLFSGQAIRGLDIFLGQGADKYKEFEKTIREANGTTKTDAEEMADNLKGALDQLKSGFQDFFIEIGDILKDDVILIADAVKGMVGKFAELDDGTKKHIVNTALKVAAIGPAFKIFSKITSPIGKVIELAGKFGVVGKFGGALKVGATFAKDFGGALGFWGKTAGGVAFKGVKLLAGGLKTGLVGGSKMALGGIKALTGFLANPLVAGIGLAIAAGVLLWKNWDTVKEKATQLREWVGGKWQGLQEIVSQTITGTVTAVTDWFTARVEGAKGLWQDTKDLVSAGIEGTVNAITGAFHTAVDWVWERWEGLKEFLSAPITGTVNIVKNGWNKLTGGDGVDGDHKVGLDYVPFDGYTGRLHQGEMILTQEASREYRAMGGTKDGLGRVKQSPSGHTRIADAPPITINIDGSGDPKAVARAVRDEINNYFRDMQIQGV